MKKLEKQNEELREIINKLEESIYQFQFLIQRQNGFLKRLIELHKSLHFSDTFLEEFQLNDSCYIELVVARDTNKIVPTITCNEYTSPNKDDISPEFYALFEAKIYIRSFLYADINRYIKHLINICKQEIKSAMSDIKENNV